MIAKYIKAGFPKEWWLTDFTMKQVEGQLDTLHARIKTLEAENKTLHETAQKANKLYAKSLIYSTNLQQGLANLRAKVRRQLKLF